MAISKGAVMANSKSALVATCDQLLDDLDDLGGEPIQPSADTSTRDSCLGRTVGGSPPRVLASRILNDSPSVTTTEAWWRRRSSMETVVAWSGRKRPHSLKGQWLARPRLRRS